MSLATRLSRIERSVPWAGETETERWQRLMNADAECVDLSIRICRDRDKRFKGLSAEEYARARLTDPLQTALFSRLQERRGEQLAGAAPTEHDETERYLKRIHDEPPPGMEATWPR